MEPRLTVWAVFAFLGLFASGKKAYYRHVWPMGEGTCGFDAETGTDAIQPKLDSCAIPLGSRHPVLFYKSLVLNGTFLDLPMRTHRKDASFTINIKPFELSGTILHYTSPLSCYHCLQELKMDLEPSGALTVTFFASGMTQPETKTMPTVRVIAGDWNYLSIGIDVGDCEVFLVYDKYGHSKVEASTRFGSKCRAYIKNNQQQLRIGDDMNGTNTFRGEVTCASVAERTKKAEFYETIVQCRLYSMTQIPAHSVFPLYDVEHAGYDIVQNKSLRHANSSKHLSVDSAIVPALGYGSLRLTGSEVSTLDLIFPFLPLQSDFTLAFYVHVQSEEKETLAQVRLTAPSPSGLREVVLQVNESQVWAFMGDGGSDPCGQAEIERSQTDDWDVIAVGRKGRSIFLVSGSKMEDAGDACTSNTFWFNDSGLLRLGGMFDEPESFRGKLACFAFFDTFFASPGLLRRSTESSCKKLRSFPAAEVLSTSIDKSLQATPSQQSSFQPTEMLRWNLSSPSSQMDQSLATILDPHTSTMLGATPMFSTQTGLGIMSQLHGEFTAMQSSSIDPESQTATEQTPVLFYTSVKTSSRISEVDSLSGLWTSFAPPSLSTLDSPETTVLQSTHSHPLPTMTASLYGEATTFLPSRVNASRSSLCSCRCHRSHHSDVMQDAEEHVSSLVRELTVDKTSLSNHRRKLSSAPDRRASSTSIAAVAIAVVATIGGLMVAMDVPRIIAVLCRCSE